MRRPRSKKERKRLRRLRRKRLRLRRKRRRLRRRRRRERRLKKLREQQALQAQQAQAVDQALDDDALLATLDLHGVNRFTAGFTPALREEVTAAGGFSAWFDDQLHAGTSDPWTDQTAGWWTSINADPDTLWARSRSEIEGLWRADANYQCWTMVRRFGSRLQVLETMADFWEHHFHVPAVGEVGPYRAAYGKVVRTHALGRFDELLPAAVLHPAMQIYLTNANSSKRAPNENLGRELLELHTVGRGEYGEDDVKDSARILTGYRMGLWTDWRFSYDERQHWTGAVHVMGFQHDNLEPDGRPGVVAAYLRHLAHHPATARRIARKLAVRFVSDEPPAALVDRLASVYQSAQTDISAVLRALVDSAEFKAARGTKVRTPSEDVVATYRALGVRLTAGPRSSTDDSAANVMLWQAMNLGLAPLAWPRPDGRPDEATAWSSTSRFLASLEMHWGMAGTWWPEIGIAYRSPASWLPATSIRFDDLVDHLTRQMLGRKADATLQAAAGKATGFGPATSITKDHDLVKWEMPRLLTALLDTPTHMSR